MILAGTNCMLHAVCVPTLPTLCFARTLCCGRYFFNTVCLVLIPSALRLPNFLITWPGNMVVAKLLNRLRRKRGPQSDCPPGTLLGQGRYKVVRVLGSGAWATV